MTETRTEAGGLYARIRIRPGPDCILRRLSEDHQVREYMPGKPGGHRPQVVVEPAADTAERSLTAEAIDETIPLGEQVVCLLRHPTGTAPSQEFDPDSARIDQSGETTADSEMVLYGFDRLPVAPVAVGVQDGWLELHLVTPAYPKLRETVTDLRAAAFDIDLRQVVQSDRASAVMLSSGSMLSTLDLSVLTDRQREVATVALDLGYFETDGATATEVADRLGVSKSTLSEHLRAVIRKLLSQVIP